MSFLEMLDVVNERLIVKGEEPIAFDHDCREGICGSCGMMINGAAHGPMKATTACQLHMRSLQGRRRDLDRAVAREGVPGDQGSGGRSRRVRPDHPGRRVRLGADGRARRTATRSRSRSRPRTTRWMRPRASAAARAWPRARTPRRSCSPRRRSRISASCRRDSPSACSARWRWCSRWISRRSAACTLFGECQEACPKGISIDTIARMNRDYLVAAATEREEALAQASG